MKQYKSTSVININGGYVELDKDQARRRAHNLEKLDDGVYGVIRPIQFKAGETFGYDGEVNKSLAQEISCMDDTVIDDLGEIEEVETPEEVEEVAGIIYPRHLGGPWYELSNGEKVMGKDNADDAELALPE